jgi:arginine/lysine/ornithine decarboxylase
MGAAIEQSSVFHVQGERVSREMLSACRDLLGTTSASGLVYASLDGWRRQMVDHGHELLSEALARARRIRRRIAELPGWQLMGTDAIGPQAAYDIDPLRITLDVRGLGISGFQAGDWLRDRCRVAVGAADVCRIGCQISIGDDDMTETRLIEALFALHFAAADLPAPPPVRMPGADAYVAEAVVSPREAFFGPVEHVPVEQAAGRVAAEMLSPYPPGVPIVVPGEVLRADALAYLTDGLAAGMLVPDAADSQLKTLRVTARSGRGS